jgi:tetratricopeptide (TPR) repeat protein
MLKTNTVFYFDSTEFIHICHHFIDEANFSLANKAIKMGLEQHPKNIDLMLLKSELLIFNSKYEDAYKILNFVEEIDPENREVFLQKATIYSKNNLSEEAIEILKRALLFIDDKLEIWNMIAMEFLLLEDFESAIPFFKKCLDYDNEDYQSLYNLIFCYENLGMIDESISELSSVLEKRPYSKIAWHQLGKIYNKQKKYKESISAFDFAIISDDQFVSAYIEKAKVLEKIDRFNEAIQNFRLSVELSEPNSFIYFRIAKCYRKIRNKKLFLEFIKKSVREEPGNEKAWIYLIKYYRKNKNYRQAKYLASKALINNHNSIKILSLNAIIYKEIGNSGEAIKFYNLILDFREDLPWKIWKRLLKCLIIKKEWSQLLKISLKAKKKHPNKPFLDFIISGCLLKNGKLNEAIYFYQSGKKICQVPKKLIKFFPEFNENKTLLV